MDAVVGLGSNLGSREALLRAAIALLGREAVAEVVAVSQLYRTPPLGPPQPEFLNAAVRVRTELSPLSLLSELQRVEAQLGRVRRERWGPRTIDLDFLWWQGGAIDEPGLSVPHPGLMERAFALGPLLDVAPELPFGARLAELDPLAPMPWAAVSRIGGVIEARALDDADALALALEAALGGVGAAEEVEPLEVSSADELVQEAARRSASRPAAVVLESLEPRAVRARLVLDPPRNRRLPAPALEHLGEGRCRIALGRPTGRPNLL